MMDIKLVCRLCCSKDEVKHSLFNLSEGGICLAEELFTITSIEITKDDKLSDHICVNCYKVNLFFKEFRKNCSEVNNYLKKFKTAEKQLPGNITIKEEKLDDDYGDQLPDPLGSTRENTSQNSDVPYPVALVQSLQKSNELKQLRSNFLTTKRTREEAGPSNTTESQNGPSSTPIRRAEKRKNDDANDTVKRQKPRVVIPTEEDLLNHVVKQEEVDIDDSPIENETLNDNSFDEPWSPPESHHSLDSGSVGGHSSPDDDYCSSASSSSSDDSDDEDDNDMLMLLALLL